MKSAAPAHPKQQMADLLATLRSYASRVLVQDDPLSSSEEQDKSLRMSQFFRMGADYRCTEKEMVGLVYEGCLS